MKNEILTSGVRRSGSMGMKETGVGNYLMNEEPHKKISIKPQLLMGN
ncbi:hypothetical protein [Methanosarcina sp.]